MQEYAEQFLARYPSVLDWAEAIGVAAVAALAALLLYRFLFRLASRLARHRPLTKALLSSVCAPGRALAGLLALQWAWDAAPDGLPKLASVQHLTTLALTGALTWLAIRAVSGVSDWIIESHPTDVSNNLDARRVVTQTRVIARILIGAVLFVGVALALMSFPAVRSVGTSLLASAGVAGLVVGFAARPALGNLIAGLQLALTQPIRLDDVVIVENEWGRIEEIGATYVVVRLWDERRLVVPLQWFIEHPFQNWTRTSSEILGTVMLWVDYRMPIPAITAELQRLCAAAPEWNRKTCVLQVTDANERAIQLRALVSSDNSGLNFDLRCKVREGLIAFVQAQHPECLPVSRVEMRSATAAPSDLGH